MQPFATTFARNGYTAVTFDFPGHGRNPKPLTGSITDENGATRVLVAEMARVAAFARPLGDGRFAVLGHSMASDIVVRFTRSRSDVAGQSMRKSLCSSPRVPLIVSMLIGTLSYFLADEWLTRGPGSARGGYFVSKLAFVISIGIAVGLDFARLFFLLMIVPVIVFVLLIYGVFSTGAVAAPVRRWWRGSRAPSPSPGRPP